MAPQGSRQALAWDKSVPYVQEMDYCRATLTLKHTGEQGGRERLL